MNPERYIVATSLGLTPNNKDEIIEICEPYIKGPADILGRDDLNGLLSKFPKIERHTFKLWLSRWRHAFEEQLSVASRNLLIVLLTLPTEVFLEDLQEAFQSFHLQQANRYNYSISSQDFMHALKELEGNFKFPSVTIPCHASIMTGVYPGEHGITGNNWFKQSFDKHDLKNAITGYVRFGTIHNPGLFQVFGKANNDLSFKVKTIFEAYKEKFPYGKCASIFEFIYRNLQN